MIGPTQSFLGGFSWVPIITRYIFQGFSTDSRKFFFHQGNLTRKNWIFHTNTIGNIDVSNGFSDPLKMLGTMKCIAIWNLNLYMCKKMCVVRVFARLCTSKTKNQCFVKFFFLGCSIQKKFKNADFSIWHMIILIHDVKIRFKAPRPCVICLCMSLISITDSLGSITIRSLSKYLKRVVLLIF